MRTKNTLMRDLAVVAAVAAFGGVPYGAASAAQPAPQQPAVQTQSDGSNTTNGQTQATQSTQSTNRIPLLPASDIVGRPVVDLHGRDAGRVNSMIIDTKDGVVEYLLIEGRGNFNLNGQLVAVPWSIVQQPRGKGAIGLTVNRKYLNRAPRIPSAELNRLDTAAWRTRVYGYYGRPYPYYGSTAWYGYPPAPIAANGQNVPPRTGTTGQANNGAPNTQPSSANGNTTASGNAQNASNNATAGKSDNANNSKTAADNQQQQQLYGLSVNGKGIVSALRSGSTVAPNQLHGTPIYGQNGNQLGQIDRVMIDTRTGHVAYALIRRGGFLGLNPTWFAVPVEALSWEANLPGGRGYVNGGGVGYGNAGGRRLVVNEQKLQSVPPVPVNEQHLITYAPRQDLARLYQHFDVKPYWTRTGGQSNASTTGQSAH